MEILAPAGDSESFFTAINNGADAIYLGLGDFNARAKSTFFNTENIAEYIKKAHLFGVKVYITTNTLIKDEEIEPFIAFAEKCVQAKPDAFIIQDWAVARIFRDCFDNVTLHASTQMGIHNLAGAKNAKEFGFSRVVLSRETKLEDIKLIKQETGLEIEYFVQGALCVAFSGNCYMSALEHNKSGNRGKCLQLCRLPYTAYSNNNFIGSGYLLSARDLCLIENLQELKDAGVDSLKIEGRLRRAGYVAQSVNSYRKAVDSLENDKKIDFKKEIFNLKQVFSRGDYNKRAYLDNGVPQNIINPQIQNHLGIKIGEVVSIQNFKDLFKVQLKLSSPINTGDGLKFLDNDKEQASIGVGNIEKSNNLYTIYTKTKLKPNWQVYKTLDSVSEQNLLSTIRKLPINAKVTANIDKPLTIEFEYNNISSTITTDYVCPQAQNSPTTVEEIKTQISKLNDTDFVLQNIEINLDNIFIPKSILNKARRECVENLEAKIIANHERSIKAIKNTQNYSIMQDILSTMQGTMQSAMQQNLDNIYIINEETDISNLSINENDVLALSPITYNKANINSLIEKAKSKTKNIALTLPIISNYKDFDILDEIITNLDKDIALIINNISGLKYANNGRKIIAGTGMNVYNNLSAFILKEMGVDAIIFSKEISSQNGFYKFAYGKNSLMTFAHCPFKTLFNNDCTQCKFNNNLELYGEDGRKYEIHRTVISQCYFTLYSKTIQDKRNGNGDVCDLRFI